MRVPIHGMDFELFKKTNFNDDWEAMVWKACPANEFSIKIQCSLPLYVSFDYA